MQATVLLKDIEQGANAFNAIWEEWINPHHAPVRSHLALDWPNKPPSSVLQRFLGRQATQQY